MRLSFLTRFSIGLFAGSVLAGPCKPHSTTATTAATSVAISSPWTADVSSSTVVLSVDTTASSAVLESDVTEATTTTAKTATTTDAEAATTTDLFSTSEATTSAISTTTASEATTTATDTDTTTDVETATTTELYKTLKATTSTIPTTATSEAPWPLETFALISSETSGPLMGLDEPWSYVLFGEVQEPNKALTLTIEPGTNRLKTTGGLHMCTYWGEPGSEGAFILCDNEEPSLKYIECTQANNGELSCIGEAVQVTRGDGGLSYSSNGDYVTQSVVQKLAGLNLYRLLLRDEPTDGFTSVTLKTVRTETQ